MIIVDILGYIAGTLTTVAFLPQLVKILKNKSAKDISLVTFLVFTTGIFTWLLYGIFTTNLPIIFANSITLVTAILILILKIKYDSEGK